MLTMRPELHAQTCWPCAKHSPSARGVVGCARQFDTAAAEAAHVWCTLRAEGCVRTSCAAWP